MLCPSATAALPVQQIECIGEGDNISFLFAAKHLPSGKVVKGALRSEHGSTGV